MIRVESALFYTCATSKDHFPGDDRPLIALVGRSNVGKSSIINTLTGRKELARTSASPGKTLTINFYLINDKFYLVDLPGYGYSKISKETKQKIQTMMDDFFFNCNSLIGILLIIDSRHLPTQHDIQMYNWLKHHKYPIITIINKVDKLSNQQLQKNKKAIQLELGVRNTIPFSSVTKIGKDEVLKAIESLLNANNSNLKSLQKLINVNDSDSHIPKPDKTNPPKSLTNTENLDKSTDSFNNFSHDNVSSECEIANTKSSDTSNSLPYENISNTYENSNDSISNIDKPQDTNSENSEEILF